MIDLIYMRDNDFNRGKGTTAEVYLYGSIEYLDIDTNKLIYELED